MSKGAINHSSYIVANQSATSKPAMNSSVLEGLLTSKQVAINSAQINNSAVVNRIKNTSSLPLKMPLTDYDYNNSHTTTSHVVNHAAERRRESADRRKDRSKLGKQTSYLDAQASIEDFNDRLIDSPKARSYVPLLSKKQNKGSLHGAVDPSMRDGNQSRGNTQERIP